MGANSFEGKACTCWQAAVQMQSSKVPLGRSKGKYQPQQLEFLCSLQRCSLCMALEPLCWATVPGSCAGEGLPEMQSSGHRPTAPAGSLGQSPSCTHIALQAVDPIVLGKVRAKQYYSDDKERHHTLGILLHGDGSFAGQGVVYETLDMSALPDYTTGGTIHIVVNNQVGYLCDLRFRCIRRWTRAINLYPRAAVLSRTRWDWPDIRPAGVASKVPLLKLVLTSFCLHKAGS